MEKFQIMGKKLEHHGHILDFYTYELKVPNGNTAYWDVLEHKGASAIIPVDEDGKIILVRQYRGAIDDLLLEIPAGGRDSLEEDFFVRTKDELVPVEVKANKNRSKSLRKLIDNESYSDIKWGIKLADSNVGIENGIYTFPYFCSFLIKRYLAKKG